MQNRITEYTKLICYFMLLFAAACKKNPLDSDCTQCNNSCNRICMIYEQTGCSDPWKYDLNNDDNQKNILISYFNNLNISLHKVELDNEGSIDHCRACFCRTGKRFKVLVDKTHLAVMIEHKFKAQ